MANSLIRLAVLGSTGSIGQQTLDIVRAFPWRFRVVGLSAGSNVELLAKQIHEFKPQLVHYEKSPSSTKINGHYEITAPEDIAHHPYVDMVVLATSGKAGLLPLLSAIKAGKKVALSNKEALVMAGEIIIAAADRYGAKILPVDSEHSAIWQCLNGETNKPSRIILTASGGPFRGYTTEALEKVTAKEALNHPSWKMGQKVTIDSATLMNKGLEVVEAHWLFRVPYENIQVVVHPQSIVHSMVEFPDGSVKAQMSCPDMHLPIQYALSYPRRWANPQIVRVDWAKVKELDFEEPDTKTFPCLKLAIEAGMAGGTCPAVLCAADEVAVEQFLAGKIGFLDIPNLVKKALDKHSGKLHPTIEEIIAADAWAREQVNQFISEVK